MLTTSISPSGNECSRISCAWDIKSKVDRFSLIITLRPNPPKMIKGKNNIVRVVSDQSGISGCSYEISSSGFRACAFISPLARN